MADARLKSLWNSLNEEEAILVKALHEAHYESCFRDNASSIAVAMAADASHDLGKAIIAGLSTLGGKHAPIEETVRFLSQASAVSQVGSLLKRGKKIPGWGGTFQKGSEDPIWREVSQLIGQQHPELHNRMKDVTLELKEYGKTLWPNPSAYTACVAITLGLPAEIAPYLFIFPRLTGWVEIATRQFF